MGAKLKVIGTQRIGQLQATLRFLPRGSGLPPSGESAAGGPPLHPLPARWQPKSDFRYSGLFIQPPLLRSQSQENRSLPSAQETRRPHSIKATARAFGCSRNTVRQWLRRQSGFGAEQLNREPQPKHCLRTVKTQLAWQGLERQTDHGAGFWEDDTNRACRAQ